MPPRRTINASGDLVEATPNGEGIHTSHNNNNRMSSFSLWDALPSAVSSSWFLYTATTSTTTPSPLDFFGFNLNGRQVAMTLAGAWIMLGSQTSTFSWCDVWRFTQYTVWVQCRVPQTVSSLILTQSLLWPAVVLYFAVALGLARSIVFFYCNFKNSGGIAGSLGHVYHMDKSSGFYRR
jgi:hypothetical protein